MKKLMFILLIAVSFAGCKKDDVVPDRDKFIGSWTGTITTVTRMNGVLYDTETSSETEKFDAGADIDQILINKNTENELKANVSGSTFKVPEQSQYVKLADGTIMEVAISGNATLSSNGVLTVGYNMEGLYKNVSITLIISETLNKN